MHAFRISRVLRVTGAVLALCAAPANAFTLADSFADNRRDLRIWGGDDRHGNGVITEANQRLEYTVGTPAADWDYAGRRLVWGKGPHDTDWYVQMKLRAAVNPTAASQIGTYGLSVVKCGDPTHEIYGEIYAEGFPVEKGFYAQMSTADALTGSSDSGKLAGLAPLAANTRISYTAATKIVRIAYKIGTVWHTLATFGVGGAGGADGNGDWAMAGGDRFCIEPYGYSEGLRVASGGLFGDTFVARGLVPAKILLVEPNGGETIDPTKNFAIEWYPPTSVDHVKLAYSCNGAAGWRAITPDPPAGATTHDWNVPDGLDGRDACWVRVAAYSGTGALLGVDASDRPFRIQIP